MKIAVIIPAHNEEQTISEVMNAFHKQLPEAELYVVDNRSTDRTVEVAQETYHRLKCSGRLLSEPRKGKAMAIRTAFQTINADVYVMVDADCTYPEEQVHELLVPIAQNEADMVVGDRLSQGDYRRENKRPLHNTGNQMVRWLMNRLYDADLHDILSGYRVFSRRFVDTFPVLCRGFELEANLTLHSLDKQLRIVEIPIQYVDRPKGSVSKLNTGRDGVRVVFLIFNIFRIYRPLVFFGGLSAACLFLSLIAGAYPIMDYLKYRYVYHVPLAVLASALSILAVLFFAIALVLDGLAFAQRIDFENKLGRYK